MLQKFLRSFCDFSVKNLCPYLNTLVSGSPIIQDGKLVGALTHVLVANPTAGSGSLSRIC
ncbi:MAG: hypothetical protein IJW71_05520 [Clostridia bacterium]|nr:hypothetical protein [Clostridia bacterium]